MAAARASPARAALILISGLLLVSFSQSAAAQRALLQSDALSNSNGCLGTIPKCETGACAVRNIQGQARWVCLRCLSNYEPVVDASGQDNIIQCGEQPLLEPAAVALNQNSRNRRGGTWGDLLRGGRSSILCLVVCRPAVAADSSRQHLHHG